jgi:hypothetical protein
MVVERMTLLILTKWKATITKMKFNKIADSILKEGEYGGWEPEENDPDKETVMNSNARYLESIANELFNIGARINSGNVKSGDGDYLQMIAGDVEHLASELK